jgi:hypothetical protein
MSALEGLMSVRGRLAGVAGFVAAAAALAHGQITMNPLPAPIEKRGLSVQIRDIVRLPDTRGLRPADQDPAVQGWARINHVREIADGRRFVSDQRGFLYVIGPDNTPRLYLDAASAFPRTWYRGLTNGLVGLAFHPDFADTGAFYTVHTERAADNPRVPDFIPPGFSPGEVTYHNVINEWRARNPASNSFDGSRRELLRVGQVTANSTHPLSLVEFNPFARPGAADYGLLYTSGSDLGFSNGGGPNANNPTQGQRTDSLVTAILRIDPRSPLVTGGTKGIGDYTVPAANRFAADGDPRTLGEIYAYGFRNAHRLSWDPSDGTMFAMDIGMNHIEEINIVREGANYGWMRREGFFENAISRTGGMLNQLFTLPAPILEGREQDGFAYPVVVYDHDEGQAITGGFSYGGRIAALRGKFIFGDIARGRLFASDVTEMKKADDGVPATVAPLEEIQLYVRDAAGGRRDVTLRELIDETRGSAIPRADLQISQTRDGELLITSRQDGTIRMLVPD